MTRRSQCGPSPPLPDAPCCCCWCRTVVTAWCSALLRLLVLLLLHAIPLPGGYLGVSCAAAAVDLTPGVDFSRQAPFEFPNGETMSAGSDPTLAPLPPEALEADNGCCRGTLGYATASYERPYPCARSGCCNDSETVAVVPVDVALGFQFLCLPWTSVQTLCYQAGSEVSTSNQDPDHVPRTCCQGAHFAILLNRWYAAMTVKCVDPFTETEGIGR